MKPLAQDTPVHLDGTALLHQALDEAGLSGI